jgi:hypothetical protein
MPLAQLFEVFGNYGSLQVDATSGRIVSIAEAESDADEIDNYRDILRFDVREWTRHYPDEDIADFRVDVVDIGFWYGSPQRYAAPLRPARDTR